MSSIYDYLSATEEEEQLMVLVQERCIRLRWKDACIELKRNRAARYLVELLLHPYQGISAAALYALVHNPLPRPASAAALGLDQACTGDTFHSLLPSPLADPKAIRDVKFRLNLLTVQIAEAGEWNDAGRLEELKLERDTLLDYLNDAFTQRNQNEFCADQDYKCADNVYHALHNLLQTISASNPELGGLLTESLHIWSDLLFVPAHRLSVLVLEQGMA